MNKCRQWCLQDEAQFNEPRLNRAAMKRQPVGFQHSDNEQWCPQDAAPLKAPRLDRAAAPFQDSDNQPYASPPYYVAATLLPPIGIQDCDGEPWDRCGNLECNSYAKEKCCVPGFCSYTCALIAGAVIEEVVPTCALPNCCRFLKKKKTNWSPFCRYTCYNNYPKIRSNVMALRDDLLECPICLWTHFSDPGNRHDNKGFPLAVEWMAWHLWHFHEEEDQQVKGICRLFEKYCIQDC